MLTSYDLGSVQCLVPRQSEVDFFDIFYYYTNQTPPQEQLVEAVGDAVCKIIGLAGPPYYYVCNVLTSFSGVLQEIYQGSSTSTFQLKIYEYKDQNQGNDPVLLKSTGFSTLTQGQSNNLELKFNSSVLLMIKVVNEHGNVIGACPLDPTDSSYNKVIFCTDGSVLQVNFTTSAVGFIKTRAELLASSKTVLMEHAKTGIFLQQQDKPLRLTAGFLLYTEENWSAFNYNWFFGSTTDKYCTIKKRTVFGNKIDTGIVVAASEWMFYINPSNTTPVTDQCLWYVNSPNSDGRFFIKQKYYNQYLIIDEKLGLRLVPGTENQLPENYFWYIYAY